MASSTSARPPAWIGKYEVLEKIGEGGFAVVYKARDPFIKRLVAVKVCISEDAELRDRFYREAEIAGNLHHRNIVTVFDFGVDDGRPYLVQEYLSGEDLKAKVRRRDLLAPTARLDILLQVAQGLSYAHSQGVLHRDVKPGNVRVLEDGSVKIMDFGIAKLATAESALTRRGSILGTAGYLPPEQVLGREADARADVFSYGSLAYELLTYESPFPGKTVSDILQQVLQSEPKPLSEIWRRCPSDLDALVHKCLRKDPVERYVDFEDLIADLTPIVERLERRAAREQRSADGMSLDETVPIPVDLLRPSSAPAPELEPTTLVPPPPPKAVGRTGRGAQPAAGGGERSGPAEPVGNPVRQEASPGSAEIPTLIQEDGESLLEQEEGSGEGGPPPSEPPVTRPMDPGLPPPPRRRARRPLAGRLRQGFAAAGGWLQPAWERAGRYRWIAAGALAALLVAAIPLVWLALRPEAAAPPKPTPTPAEPTPPAAVERGLLIIDARPWAQVRALVDGDGTELPLPEDPYTPLALRLPPGHYRVSLVHPQATTPATCDVRVTADAGGRCWADLGKVEAESYFRESGWWR